MKSKLCSLLALGLISSACTHSFKAPPGDESLVYEVEVRDGETLQQVGEQYSVSTPTLQRINRLNTDEELKAGQILYIPVSEKTKQSADLRGRAKVKEVPSEASLPGSEEESVEGGRRGELYTQFRALQWPLDGKVLSPFGRRSGRPHKGIDIFPHPGEKDILAARNGVVEFAGRKSKFGNVVIINHKNFKTLYAHCEKILVKKGQEVGKGEQIAVVGRTGNAEGVHLHFEYQTLKNRPLDPMPHFQREVAH